MRKQKNFFTNDALPGGIIQSDRPLSDGEFQSLRQAWGDLHRGNENAHRVPIFDGGFVVPIKMAQELVHAAKRPTTILPRLPRMKMPRLGRP